MFNKDILFYFVMIFTILNFGTFWAHVCITRVPEYTRLHSVHVYPNTHTCITCVPRIHMPALHVYPNTYTCIIRVPEYTCPRRHYTCTRIHTVYFKIITDKLHSDHGEILFIIININRYKIDVAIVYYFVPI